MNGLQEGLARGRGGMIVLYSTKKYFLDFFFVLYTRIGAGGSPTTILLDV